MPKLCNNIKETINISNKKKLFPHVSQNSSNIIRLLYIIMKEMLRSK